MYNSSLSSPLHAANARFSGLQRGIHKHKALHNSNCLAQIRIFLHELVSPIYSISKIRIM